MLNPDAHYSGLVATRNSETAIRWQRVQIFFLINSALLGAVAGGTISIYFKLARCFLGLVITVIWFLMQLEAQSAIDYWNGHIATLEQQDQETKVKAFDFAAPREGFEVRYASTYYLILILITMFGLGWLSLLVYYL